MKAPIKERIVVLRYKRLDVEAYRRICDMLKGFLLAKLSDLSFSEERINSPEVTVPVPTVGAQEPDWSKLKVSIDRQSRFWNAQHTRCVQFFRDYLTINCIVPSPSKPGSYSELKEFFVALLPFLRENAKAFKILTAGIDYENRLDDLHLQAFLKDGGQRLELQELFNCFRVGPRIDGADFVTPINQKTSWTSLPDTTPYAYRLTESIEVPATKATDGWRVRVLLSASSAQFPGLDSDSVQDFFDCMHGVIDAGFHATFTETALKEIGVSK